MRQALSAGPTADVGTVIDVYTRVNVDGRVNVRCPVESGSPLEPVRLNRLHSLKLQEAEARGELGAKNGGAPLGNKNAQGGTNNLDNSKVVWGGTSTTYTYRRLLRDRPDLAAQVKARTMSANAAAIMAGFRNMRDRPTPCCAIFGFGDGRRKNQARQSAKLRREGLFLIDCRDCLR